MQHLFLNTLIEKSWGLNFIRKQKDKKKHKEPQKKNNETIRGLETQIKTEPKMKIRHESCIRT